MILVTLLIAAALLCYWRLSKLYNHWTVRGVKQRKQVYFLGDNGKTILRMQSFFDLLLDIYRTFPEERYFGMYQGTIPTLMIRDPEIIKQVTVKEFDHFLNHRTFIPENVEPLFGKNLFSLKDTEWRDMRSTLSPSFTSSKMKMIFTLVSECANIYVDHFLQKGKTVTIELKDTFSRYTNDVIATVAFGINCDSINNKTNDFFLFGKNVTTFTFWRGLVFFFYTISPTLCKILRLTFLPKTMSAFFIKLIKETIDVREREGIVRPDMINLLLEARKGVKSDNSKSPNTLDTGFATAEESSIHTENRSTIKQELTDMDITSQAMIFFFAGFETVSTLMCFLGYELAVNPDIQKRLQEEVDKTLKECNGKLTYEALMKMKYMDMVVSETLRKWPAAALTDRVCSKPFTIEAEKPHERAVHLEPGDLIAIPINGIHRDPQYYPNPDLFDPERFNDENKANIKPYTYMPFGLGPRNCIGSRFALLEAKCVIFHFLSKFSFIVVEKTQVPLVLSKKSLNLVAENGTWLGLQPRHNQIVN